MFRDLRCNQPNNSRWCYICFYFATNVSGLTFRKGQRLFQRLPELCVDGKGAMFQDSLGLWSETLKPDIKPALWGNVKITDPPAHRFTSAWRKLSNEDHIVYFSSHHRNPIAFDSILIILNIGAAILLWFLPETRGLALPQTSADLDVFQVSPTCKPELRRSLP